MATKRRRTALGWKTHTGWAMAVAIAVEPESEEPAVVLKRRVEIAATFDEGAIYHGAQELPLARAEPMIRAAEERLAERARVAVAALVEELGASGCALVGSGMVGAQRALPPLESILKSHALVHTAEGELYRRLFDQASEEAARVPTARFPARELAARAASALHLSEAELARRFAALGKRSGRPWAADHKESALAAWLALHSHD